MKAILSDLTVQHKLALLAVGLGFLALFAGSPYHESRAIVDAQELALSIGKADDHVTVEELADWLIEGRADFRLLDVRDEGEYAEYHIPGAENAPVVQLADYPLLRNERIILYSNGGIHAAQAAFLLQAKDFKGVYTLLGGLEAWKSEVLFPMLPADPDPQQQATFEKRKEIARHFGGAPQTGGVSEEKTLEPPELPELEMPAQTAPVLRRKKPREGC